MLSDKEIQGQLASSSCDHSFGSEARANCESNDDPRRRESTKAAQGFEAIHNSPMDLAVWGIVSFFIATTKPINKE